MFIKLLKLNNPCPRQGFGRQVCACPVRREFSNGVLCGEVFPSTANEGGRLRWKIENEGFNMQKNGGYNLEHPYSKDEVAMKNFYLLLQIAHIISQLIEKGSLLKKEIKKVLGSIRNVSRMLLESLRTKPPDIEELQMELSIPFQIRFYDSS